jgi:hypothetical protein
MAGENIVTINEQNFGQEVTSIDDPGSPGFLGGMVRALQNDRAFLNELADRI